MQLLRERLINIAPTETLVSLLGAMEYERGTLCRSVLNALLPMLDKISPPPQEGWLACAYAELCHGLFPDPNHQALPDEIQQGVALLLPALDAALACEEAPFDPLTDLLPFDEALCKDSRVKEEYARFLTELAASRYLLTLRLAREIMPFDSIKEAWDVIYEKAENGCAFCQYMIGNTYYFLDIIEIEDQKESNFANKGAWNEWKRLQIKQCLPWFEKAFSGGMILAGRNYGQYYQYGRGEYIPAEPGKEVPIIRQGAERGYPEWMYAYAHYLAYTEDNDKEALPWALKAVEAGHLWGWHIIGDIYWNGRAVERNLPYALECYKKTASYGNSLISFNLP